jgi:hypothetical protein
MKPDVDVIAIIATALAERVAESRREAADTFQLVDRVGACKLLGVSPDYFREQIEPHVPVVSLPSAGNKRQFRRWDIQDLKAFVSTLKRGPGHEKQAS